MVVYNKKITRLRIIIIQILNYYAQKFWVLISLIGTKILIILSIMTSTTNFKKNNLVSK